jgi:hypothetical protein
MNEQHDHRDDDEPAIPHVEMPGQRPSTPAPGVALRIPGQRRTEQPSD